MRHRICHEQFLPTAADLRMGQKAVITELGRGRGFRARMFGLGIRPGAEMRILDMHKKGPCVVEVGRCRVMLGSELLSGIILKGEKDYEQSSEAVGNEA